MRSIITHIVVTGFIAASAIVPASAATHHKRAAAPAQREHSAEGLESAPVSARPTSPVQYEPNTCMSDEGYGRFSPCGATGG